MKQKRSSQKNLALSIYGVFMVPKKDFMEEGFYNKVVMPSFGNGHMKTLW
jgi:hypothetical protein